MVTSLLYQPSALGPGLVVGKPLSSGAVLSMLIPLTVVLALLPAASVAVPVMLWLLPSPRVTGAGQTSTPERVSAQVKVTVTLPLYQPPALAVRFRAALIVGGVLSMLMNATSLALFPALS